MADFAPFRSQDRREGHRNGVSGLVPLRASYPRNCKQHPLGYYWLGPDAKPYFPISLPNNIEDVSKVSPMQSCQQSFSTFITAKPQRTRRTADNQASHRFLPPRFLQRVILELKDLQQHDAAAGELIQHLNLGTLRGWLCKCWQVLRAIAVPEALSN